MKYSFSFAAAISLSLLLSSCAPQIGGNHYSSSNVGEISQTYRGRISSVRVVEIHAKDASEMGEGAVLGGLGGAVLGSQLGKGSGSVVTGILGAAAGGFAGHAAQQNLTKQQGFEYQIQLDSGNLITLTQGATPELVVGQRVLVIESSKGRSRVVADTTTP